MPINAWSIEDVRAAEADAMADLPDGELMQRAARGLAHVVSARLPGLGGVGGVGGAGGAGGTGGVVGGDGPPGVDTAPRVVVLAGSGGNGGDALYAASFLAQDAQALVVAVLVTPHAHTPAREAARDAGVLVLEVAPQESSTSASGAGEPGSGTAGSRTSGSQASGSRTSAPQEPETALEEALALLAEADLVIDGITGIGGRPGLSEAFASAWRLVQAVPPDAYVVAVDLPSGADPSGERPVSDAVFADETVTFGICKPVHVLAGADACGLLTVVDIGLDEPPQPAAVRLEHDDIAALWPVPGPSDDKYTRGVLGVVAGGATYTGAAVLAVTSAVCSGAGMVRYVGPRHAADIVRVHVPEAVYGTGRVQAWLVGSGLDAAVPADDEKGRAQVEAARAALDSAEPCVVDAGGLELLQGPRPHSGARTLLTPHAGELARLLSRLEGGDITPEQVRAEPIAHARRAARALHATVLLKGSTTYIVPPVDALPVYAQADAPAWLGTAGSGDVLAGLAGTLLAAGLDPLRAGALAAQVHGLAGHQANPDGPVRALDVAHAIPEVVAHALRRVAL